jgi:regulator of replication initiation timing
MSTSPSWFDQEKFSRLVKKVGPKTVTGALPGPPGAAPGNRSLSGEGLASTARISLVSRPPSLLSEQRALPALPRRTTPLPTLKALFSQSTPPRYSPPPGQPPTEATEESGPETSTEAFPGSEEVKEETGVPTDDATREADAGAPFSQEGEELAAVWQKMGQLNEELAHTVQERDQAVSEGIHLREQLRHAQEAVKEQGDPARAQELSLLTEERDQARREYATLRKEFEALKQEQAPKEESGKARKELERQLEGFRQKLEERNREIVALKANSGGAGDGDDKPGQEAASLRDQLARATEEASMARRGLILSQKALQETRDTLREATEGTSLSRHNFDNLKNECATLAQQNTVLQAQNDQLSRDLAAAKAAKSTGRL